MRFALRMVMWRVLAAGFIMAAPAGGAWAFPGMTGGGKSKAPNADANGKAPVKKPVSTVKARYDRVLEELELSDEKAAEVKKILDENYKALMAWVAKVDPEVVKLRQQMRAVHGTTDPETIKKTNIALKRYRELQREMARKIEEVYVPLGKVITPEQLETVRGILLPNSTKGLNKAAADNPFHLLMNLKLSNEQIAKISEIMDEARKANKGKAEDMMGFHSKVWKRITKEVLNAEQRKQFEDARTEAAHRRMALAILGGLKLTDLQMDRVDAIWKEAYNAAAKKPKERMAIYSKATDRIIDEVLTDKQREQLKKNRRGAPHPMPMGS